MGKGKDFRDRVLKAAVSSATPTVIGAAAIVGIASAAHAVPAQLVINEVYGGGGSTNTSAAYNQDYIELYNNGTSAVTLTGDYIEYASAAGSFPTSAGSSDYLLKAGSLAPGGYYLISGASGSTGGAALPVTPDQTTAFAISSSAGKVELLNSDLTVDDLIGFGTTASAYEGTAAAPGLTVNTTDTRTGGVDTDHNDVDFKNVASTTAAPQTGGFTAAAPEPTSLGLLGAASAMVIGRRRRK